MSGNPFAAFLPYSIGVDGKKIAGASVHVLPADDLFGSTEAFVVRLLSGSASFDEPHGLAAPLTAFVIAPNVAITVDLASVRPSHIQCLLVHLRQNLPPTRDGALAGHPIDPAAGLTFWTCGGSAAAEAAGQAWREIVAAGYVENLVALTTPSLYGNKLRLTRFLAPVVMTSLPAAAPLLDIMAGTGIIARTLSDRYPVSVNDPNPYAALLSRGQGIDASNIDVADLVAALRPTYADNHEGLMRLIGSQIEEERGFLHGDPDMTAMERYVAFTETEVLPVTEGLGSNVARLVTERYANVYFGIEQAVEIDSLRSAIEHAFPIQSAERDLCLGALIVACTTCMTGPHFAQPSRPRSPKTFRTIVERRARSVAWEFDLALGRLVARRPPKIPMGPATSLDWRTALDCFAHSTSGGPAGVYIDPPYSKLQYSRYYHVLNVLLSYDYPAVSGTGRYPPVDHRFSSRFEYQPGVAQRELAALLGACASKRLTTILSYGDGGFAQVDSIARVMAGLFTHVSVFSEELRHHSQGRPLRESRATVIEYALVGHPG